MTPQRDENEGDRSEEPMMRVVVNDEEQYSVWPARKVLPLGWREAGTVGTREQCLDHIAEVWTDMRPASLRRALTADDTRRADEGP